MASKYFRIVCVTGEHTRTTAWVKQLSKTVFEKVNVEGEEMEPRHLFLVAAADIISLTPAVMNLKYGILEVAYRSLEQIMKEGK